MVTTDLKKISHGYLSVIISLPRRPKCTINIVPCDNFSIGFITPYVWGRTVETLCEDVPVINHVINQDTVHDSSYIATQTSVPEIWMFQKGVCDYNSMLQCTYNLVKISKLEGHHFK